VLESYLDASGTDPNQQVVVVAGWGAAEDEWDHWEHRWLGMLAELELKKGWHHTDFLGKRAEYAKWSDTKFQYAQGLITKIFNEIGLLGIGAAVWRADYEAALASRKWPKMKSDPYAFCLNDCAESLVHGFHESPDDEGIAIYADKDGKNAETIGVPLFEWHSEYNRRNEKAVNAARAVTITYGPATQFIPIQGADILANETYRYMFKKTRMPRLGGIFVGSEDTASPIVRALHGPFGDHKAFLDVLLYNKGMLEERLSDLESGEHLSRDPNIGRRFIPTKI
jgi:Protein of unknown function (DUF3800)